WQTATIDAYACRHYLEFLRDCVDKEKIYQINERLDSS
ncbi:MAG: hypothetical protein RLZZ481_1501, partial [Pseudomonadota bacterium]